jgi:hypothetical protein
MNHDQMTGSVAAVVYAPDDMVNMRSHFLRDPLTIYDEKKRHFVGQDFWARGYFVPTVGRDEAMMREYIRNQEPEDKRMDQKTLCAVALPCHWKVAQKLKPRLCPRILTCNPCWPASARMRSAHFTYLLPKK